MGCILHETKAFCLAGLNRKKRGASLTPSSGWLILAELRLRISPFTLNEEAGLSV